MINQFSFSRRYLLNVAAGTILDNSMFPAAAGAPVGLNYGFINGVSFTTDHFAAGPVFMSAELTFTGINGTAGNLIASGVIDGIGAYKALELSGINIGIDASQPFVLTNLSNVASGALRFTMVYSFSP